jgi:hypothetical protein
MLVEYGETKGKSDSFKLLPNNSSELVVKKDFLTEEETNLIE